MKSSTWLPVLEQLAKGELISGSQLGANLSVSRAAVWQRVEYLKSIGVDIQASDLGYRLSHAVYLPDLRNDTRSRGDRRSIYCLKCVQPILWSLNHGQNDVL